VHTSVLNENLVHTFGVTCALRLQASSDVNVGVPMNLMYAQHQCAQYALYIDIINVHTVFISIALYAPLAIFISICIDIKNATLACVYI
jgi:hypothetical protein